jgi:hypothetical protein
MRTRLFYQSENTRCSGSTGLGGTLSGFIVVMRLAPPCHNHRQRILALRKLGSVVGGASFVTFGAPATLLSIRVEMPSKTSSDANLIWKAMTDSEFYAYITRISRLKCKAIAGIGHGELFHSNMPGIGVGTLRRLQADQVIERAGTSSNGEPTFRLTKDGQRVHKALRGMGKLPGLSGAPGKQL